MAKAGRTSKYSEEVATEICAAISSSSEGLDAICKRLSLGSTTVYRWLENDATFRERYARARAQQQEVFADELVALADTERMRGDRDNVERSKLQIETRKWLLAKLNPKKYGDKVQNEHTGDGGGPIKFQLERIAPSRTESKP